MSILECPLKYNFEAVISITEELNDPCSVQRPIYCIRLNVYKGVALKKQRVDGNRYNYTEMKHKKTQGEMTFIHFTRKNQAHFA